MKQIRPYILKHKVRVFFNGSDENYICEFTLEQLIKTRNNPDVRRVDFLKYICDFNV